MPCSVAIVFAFRAQHESVEPARLANRLKPVKPPGEDLVNIGLVADVEQQLVLGRIKNRVQRQREFHHAEVGAKVSAGLR